MAKYRNELPQLSGSIFLTDGGIETSLIFDEGLDLPHFAAFHLLTDVRGRERLIEIYRKGKIAEAFRAFKKIYLGIVDEVMDHLESAEAGHFSRRVR